jgi:hypothetical protein
MKIMAFFFTDCTDFTEVVNWCHSCNQCDLKFGAALNKDSTVQERDATILNSVQMPGAKKYFMKRTESYL